MKKISTLLFVASIFASPLVKAQLSYNDVSSIFYAHCTSCHHDGGVAPFALMDFDETSVFSTSIYGSISSGSMPPWQADTTYSTSGRTVPHFLNENLLTELERDSVLQWITDGVLEGDTLLAVVAPQYGNVIEQLNGNPDLTLRIPTFRSNASSGLLNPYNCFVVPTNLTSGRWMRAFEVVPGNLKAVHHVVISVDTMGTEVTDTSGSCALQGGDFDMGGWTPGSPPTIYPSKAPLKAGMYIPAGASLVIQMHYAPGSDGMIDSTKVRMFFYPEGETGIRKVLSNTLLQDWGTLVERGFGKKQFPANQVVERKASPATSILPITAPPTTDYSILGVNPHSHSVCTSIKNYAYNGTDTIPLIRIPNWDFNWEGYYFFPQPVKIPAGYTLEAVHVFDNTTANTHLDGPPVATEYGQGTEDEMLFDSFIYMDYEVGDENIDLKAMIEDDTLLIVDTTIIIRPTVVVPATVGVDEHSVLEFDSYIYPNPASNKLTIHLSNSSTYIARIYNLMGQVVFTTEMFVDKVVVAVNDIPAGLYIIEIVDTSTNDKVAKKVVIKDE